MKICIILTMGMLLLLAGCISNPPTNDVNESNTLQITDSSPNVTEATAGGVERVEIIHFHGTHQCTSCIKVGELAEKTVNTYFKNELESGKIVFAHINGDLPENQELVNKYGVTGSSLWIGTYVNGEFYKEQNVNVWYKIDNEADYLEYLKGILEKRLAGELN
ncbi:hypothetical protein KKF81_06550 [Candidatus Micrarchaeota archaeon]|nr:hypothetical protein [Candidatus Micrarchaeota archaeon]MBU1166588.1 hypothetical protein [Candidatus Micrarchaeota archaeon]MBU1887280.1 hypothetical protein [Candidatus Micrarchaeota archaeon]